MQSSTLLPQHHELLNELASLSQSAEPSAFHSFLSRLDGEGRLLRCYTQNIDGLEARAGLEVGLPARPAKSPRKKSPQDATTMHPAAPRCIPLHGQLTHLFCPLCPTVVPLDDYLPLPPESMPCPTCNLSSTIRHALSERQRKVGSLRASVVLYGEEHPQGELIGTVVERDLRGTGRKGEKEGKADLLLVIGTSLAIPGVKRIVKEMARSLNPKSGPKAIFVNRDTPKGTEWEDVFDTFISGDIQEFTKGYLENPAYTAAEPPRTPRKRRAGVPPTPDTTPARRALSKRAPRTPQSTPSKKRCLPQTRMPPTPRPTPPGKAQALQTLNDSPPTPSSLETCAAVEGDNPFLVCR